MPDMHTCTCASFVCCTRHNNDFGDDMCQAKVLAAWVAKSVLWPILPAPAADSEPAWWPRERERERERIGGPDARTSVRFWLMAVNVIELVLAAVPRCLLPSLATIAIPWTQDPNCSEPVNLTCAEL